MLRKKRNQRRLTYIGMGIVIFALFLSFVFAQHASSERNYILVQRQQKLLKLNSELQEVQKLQTSTKKQVEAKDAQIKRIEAEKKELNNKLQAKVKAGREKQLASVVAVATPSLPKPIQTTYTPQVRVSAAGNLYAPGFCTYGVKMWRPDIPNRWGNADRWIYSAQASGWATGSVPRVGAVAVARTYMHVALVIGVSGSSVTVKEMNYGGLWVVSTRDTPISEWNYIY